ncbi:hypothetical protein BH20VER1_BH20VER1_15310 [soil metagenome]
MKRALSQLLCLAICALLLGCQPKRLRKANVDQVQEGMAKKQVESILGLPTSIETMQRDLSTKTTYVYVQDEDRVTIVFWDDKLETKQSTLKE